MSLILGALGKLYNFGTKFELFLPTIFDFLLELFLFGKMKNFEKFTF